MRGGWGGEPGLRRGAGLLKISLDQRVFQNEPDFTDSHSRGGAGEVGGVNILKLHDVVMYQTVNSRSAWSLQGSG